MRKTPIIVYGKLPKGDEKVKTYCLFKGGYWFMDREQISQAKRGGFKIIIKDG